MKLQVYSSDEVFSRATSKVNVSACINLIMGSCDQVQLLVFVLLTLGSGVSEADPSPDAVAEPLANPGPLALAHPGPLANPGPFADPGPLANPRPDPEGRNSLLTDRALLSPFNPLASPFGPLRSQILDPF